MWKTDKTVRFVRNQQLGSKIILHGNVVYSANHCKFLNARFECNDIVIFINSHYPLDPNAKLSDKVPVQ